ncbi:MAG: hypothetical protein H6608_03405 [Flavobacteriales bacterium]|nr:hypothetical protein [Flavobacteriales bacterium]
MRLKIILHLTLLGWGMASAQLPYHKKSFSLLSMDLEPTNRGGLYIMAQSDTYAVCRFGRTNYGPNTPEYDLLLFDKTSRRMHVLTSLEELTKNYYEFTSASISMDTIFLSGARFNAEKQTRVSFDRVYIGNRMVSDQETNYRYPVHPVSTYRYFETYDCLAQIADSTYVFVDHKYYGTISPAAGLTNFAKRKIYTYDYIHQTLKIDSIPPFENRARVKTFERVLMRNDSVMAIGFYRDTSDKNATVSGAYLADLNTRKIITTPLQMRYEGNWINHASISRMAWNQKDFTIGKMHLSTFEMHDQNILVLGYTPDSICWFRQVENGSTRGPYPRFTAVNDGMMMVGYGDQPGILSVPYLYKLGRTEAQLQWIDTNGTVQYLTGTPIASPGEAYLYADALMPVGDHEVAVFYYHRKKKKIMVDILRY